MKIQTTHVGSLPRPAEMIVRQTRKEEISSEDLKKFVAGIVDRQLSLELSYINNGEIARADYISATTQRISGFNETCFAPLPRDLEELPEYSRRFSGRNGLITLNPKAPISLPACSEELSYTGEASLREELEMFTGAFAEQKKAKPETDTVLFFTAPSPGTVALFLANRFYPDYQTYLSKLGEILRREYEIILSYGVFLQIDCPDLAMGRHTAYKELSDSEFLDIVEMNINTLNASLAGLDPGKCRAHICWGNYPGTHHCDIPFRTIFPSVANLRPRFISLESCNHRHAHEWAVFKELSFPEDKVLMPGVIDTTSNTVEHPEVVCERLLNFAGILGPERVIASTDCGFASTASATSVSGEVAWLKLEALVKGAEIAGKKL